MNRLVCIFVSAAFLAPLCVVSPGVAWSQGQRVADRNRGKPSAATKRKAKRFVDAGLAHQEQGEYEEAIRWFRKAYELIPHPQLLYNIGIAHKAAGHRQSALDFLRQYLERAPDGQWSKEARAAMAAIERELARGVDTRAEAQRQFQDLYSAVGADLDKLAELPGEVVDDAEVEPLRERYQDIDVPGEGAEEGRWLAATKRVKKLRREIRAALAKAEERAEAAQSDSGQAPGAEFTATGDPGPVDTGSSGRFSRVTGWVLMGVGVASLAVGGVAGMKARSIADEMSDPLATPEWTFDQIERDQEGQTLGRQAVIFTGVGAASVVLGLTLYLRGRSAGKRKRQALTWSPTVHTDHVGVTLGGTF